MLHDAFEAKKRMNPHVTDDTPIDAMLDAARDAGATGGKICGAGGGGYLLIACSPRTSGRRCASSLEAMGGQFAPFDFDPNGVRARRGDEIWTPPPRDRGSAVRACSTATGRSTSRSTTSTDPDELVLIPGSAAAIRRLREDLGLGIVDRDQPGERGSRLALARRSSMRIHERLRSMLAARGRDGRCGARVPACRPRMGALSQAADRAWPSRQPSGSGSIPTDAFVVRRSRRGHGHGSGDRGHDDPRAHGPRTRTRSSALAGTPTTSSPTSPQPSLSSRGSCSGEPATQATSRGHHVSDEGVPPRRRRLPAAKPPTRCRPPAIACLDDIVAAADRPRRRAPRPAARC